MQFDEIDVVLSGSSTKYPCHVGFLKALQSCTIKRIAANSGGSMIGGFVAAGVDIDDLMRVVVDLDIRQFIDFGMWAARRFHYYGYLSDGKKFMKLLRKYTMNKKLADIDIPIYIMVSNFTNRTLRIISQETDSDMSLAEAIYMSCSCMGYFKPIIKNGCTFRDGNIHKDFPWDVLDGVPRVRIGHLIDIPVYTLIDGRDWSGRMEFATFNENISHLNVQQSIKNGPQEPQGYIVKSHGLCMPSTDMVVSKSQKIAMIHEGYNNTVEVLRHHSKYNSKGKA